MEYANQGRWRQAHKWYERALAFGDRTAGIDVALCMLTGRGARLDAVRAYRLVATVVIMRPPIDVSPFEHEQAVALLGVMTARGIGTTKSITKAQRWLRKANADGDYAEAARALKNLDAVAALDIVRFLPWRALRTTRATAKRRKKSEQLNRRKSTSNSDRS